MEKYIANQTGKQREKHMRNKIYFKKKNLLSSPQGFKNFCFDPHRNRNLITIDIRDSNGTLHCINGPSAIDIEIKTKKIHEYYFIGGTILSRKQWLKLKEEIL